MRIISSKSFCCYSIFSREDDCIFRDILENIMQLRICVYDNLWDEKGNLLIFDDIFGIFIVWRRGNVLNTDKMQYRDMQYVSLNCQVN